MSRTNFEFCLSVLDGTIMYDRRVFIPDAPRQEVLQRLHTAHQGRAQHTVFSPGIYNDLEVMRANCKECNVKAPSQEAIPPKPMASPH